MFRSVTLKCSLVLAVMAAFAGAASAASIPSDRLQAIEALVVQSVEAARVKLSPHAVTFAVDPELTSVAAARSIDMAKTGTLAHPRSGELTRAVTPAFGFSPFAVGENILCDEAPASDPGAAAARIVATWLASKPHAANIANDTFDKIGVGVAEHDGTLYVSLVLAGVVHTPTPMLQ